MTIGSPVIQFPDGEALLIGAVNSELEARSNPARASSKVPTTVPATFVVIMRAGGAGGNLISENGTYLVEAWADNDEDAAAQLLNLVLGILNAQEGDIWGVRRISDPSNLPDPTTHSVRYTATISARTRGAGV